jgi:hypothetical protein
MTKNVSIVLLAVIAIMLTLIMCGRGNREGVSKSESDATESFRADSIQNIKTDSLISHKNSQIRRFEKQDSISRIKVLSLAKENSRLRTLVKHISVIRADSSGQVVNGVPVEEYNALIESGNLCDSIISEQNKRIAGKDSINESNENIIVALKASNATKELALQDIIALAAQEKQEKGKAKKLNRKIPLIATISGLAGTLITIFLLR